MAIVINGSGTLTGVNATGISSAPTNATDTTKLPLAGGTMTGEIVLNSTNLTCGDSTSNANKIRMGASDDLNIHHDGSNSYIEDSGTGALRILGSSIELRNAPSDNELMLKATVDGSVELYYNNFKKFETEASGVLIQGEVDGNGGGFRIKSGSATLGGIFKSGTIEGNGNSDVTVFAETGKNIHLCANGSATKVLSVSANGLLFNGETAAANALDYYEEGSWNPAFTGSGGSIGSTNVGEWEGYYTRIGRLVTVQFKITLSNKGSWSGEVRLTGLPYSVQVTLPAAGSCALANVNYSGSSVGNINIYVTAGVTYFRPRYTHDNDVQAMVQVSECTNTSQFQGAFSYITVGS